VATEKGVPLKRVLAEASYEFQKRLGRELGMSVSAIMNRRDGEGRSDRKQVRLLAGLRPWARWWWLFPAARTRLFWLGRRTARWEKMLWRSPRYRRVFRNTTGNKRPLCARVGSAARIYRHARNRESALRRERARPLLSLQERAFRELGKLRAARGFAAVAYGVNADDLAISGPAIAPRGNTKWPRRCSTPV
jgi:hypothetical protein